VTLQEIENWLRETDPRKVAELYARADDLRKESVGDAVHLRGLLEISNICVRRCRYCGLNSTNRDLTRYRMTRDEILQCVHLAVRYGYGTVVMQAGEDNGITADWLADVINHIKRITPLAVTLSLGERTASELASWRAAGADRYLLRFETSNRTLYNRIHPARDAADTSDRFELLGVLKQQGYEVGSGVMIGIPGQTYRSLAQDIEWFRRLDLDMVGMGPFIPHPGTPLGRFQGEPVKSERVPNTNTMAYKVVALTRLACPEANIPATTALATIDRQQGRRHGLTRGANVLMPNITPVHYRRLYEIYPSKACMFETSEMSCLNTLAPIRQLERTVGRGRGDRIRHIR